MGDCVVTKGIGCQYKLRMYQTYLTTEDSLIVIRGILASDRSERIDTIFNHAAIKIIGNILSPIIIEIIGSQYRPIM